MNWDTLNTYQDWADALDAILTKAHDAIAVNNVPNKLAAQRQLKAFIDNCSAPVKARELDDIATAAIHNIFEDTLEKAMAEIGSRTAELAALTKRINAVTDDANQDAAILRLEKARMVVDTTLQTVAALNTLKQTLKTEQPDEKQLADSIATLVGTIQTVRNQVENLKQ